MAINTEQITVRIGGSSAALTAALRSATAQIDAWARGLAANMGRRIRAYTERLISVGLVLGVVRSLRQMAKDIDTVFEKSDELKISASDLLRFRGAARELGISAKRADDLATALMKATRNAANLTDAARELNREFRGMSTEQMQAEILKRTGRYVLPEELWAMLGTAEGRYQPGPRDVIGMWVADSMRFFRSAFQKAFDWMGKIPTSAFPIRFLRESYRSYEEELRDRVETQHVVRAMATEMMRREEMEQRMTEIARKRLDQEIELARERERYAEAERLARRKLDEINDRIVEASRKNDAVALEEQRNELLKVELEILRLRGEAQRKAQERLRERERLEEAHNREIRRAMERVTDLQTKAERLRLYPDLEQLSAVRLGRRVPPPQALMAQRALWLERAVPWLRARGVFGLADALEREMWSIRSRLADLGFIRREESLLEVLRSLESARSELERLRTMAEQQGIRVKPELDT